MALELVELHERDRGEHVREVRLVAGDGEVVARAVAPAHEPEVLHGRGDGVVVRGEQAALAGGDVLRRVEGEAGRRGEAAELAAAVGRLERVGGVLDHRQAERPERVEVGRLAVEVHGEDRLRPLGDRLGDAGRVDVQRVVLHVDEDRRRAGVDDHVRGRRPGDRGRDHLVAGADAEGDEREVQRGRAGGEREHVLGLEVLGRAPLELGRGGPGREPAGAQRRGDGGDLLLADRGGLEADRAPRRGDVRHRRGRVLVRPVGT